MQKEIDILSKTNTLLYKIRSYTELMKLRLSSLVLLSAILGYLIGAEDFSFTDIVLLFLGGFFVTGASNAFNQIWERDLDILMNRTKNRPLPQGKITVFESLMVGLILGISGVVLLYCLNNICAILGVLALVLYVAVYTPLKTITPFAVFVGAIPGSIPPMLGYVAASAKFGLEPGILFMIQFFWQFPHFWAIAWKLDEDYKKAGFRLLPSGLRDRKSAFQIMLYSSFLIPVSMLPWATNISGVTSMIIAVILSILVFIPSILLYLKMEMKYANMIMYFSFAYLPLLLFTYYFDKI